MFFNVEEFVKKYQHCETFYELYNTLIEEGYFFTHGIWDDSYNPKDFIEIKHPITQKGKRFKKNKLFCFIVLCISNIYSTFVLFFLYVSKTITFS